MGEKKGITFKMGKNYFCACFTVFQGAIKQTQKSGH